MIRCRHKSTIDATVGVKGKPHVVANALWCTACGAFKVAWCRWRRPSGAKKERRARPSKRQLKIEGI